MANTNISLGTYVQDGVRSGPIYGSNVITNNSGIVISNSYDNYGPGVLFSAQNTWNIVPNQFNPGAGGYSSLNNVVALTLAANLPAAGNLTLRGDNYVTFLNNGVLQLDWPRVITVTIAGANAGNRVVSIVGTDWYGVPLQQNYAVQAQATYPTIELGEGTSGTFANPAQAKAFYTINQVYINGALGVNSSISLGASDVFGLPYRVNNFGDITSIGWDEASDLIVFEAEAPLTAAGVFIPADSTFPATSTTGDVRGLYGPSTISNGVRRLRFTSYVMGADTWINQVANVQQMFKVNNPTSPASWNPGVAQAPLTLRDLYGVPQFYNGPITG